MASPIVILTAVESGLGFLLTGALVGRACAVVQVEDALPAFMAGRPGGEARRGLRVRCCIPRATCALSGMTVQSPSSWLQALVDEIRVQ